MDSVKKNHLPLTTFRYLKRFHLWKYPFYRIDDFYNHSSLDLYICFVNIHNSWNYIISECPFTQTVGPLGT